MRKTIFIFLSLGTIISCKEKIQNTENKENQQANKSQPIRNDSINVKLKSSDEFSFMKVKMEKLPVLEATNFDTYDESYRKKHPSARVYTQLSNEQAEKLGLQEWLKSSQNISVNYQLSYPGNFKTFVFTYQDGEMKLKTVMVTFDNNYKKIDELLVAYDEIAESARRMESKLSNHKIQVQEYDESSGQLETTSTSYIINKSGKFVIQR